MSRCPRRTFLSALGLSGLGLGGFGSCPEATAAPALPAREGGPLRFVGVYTPHGRAHEHWKPGPDFDLRGPNSALEPFDSEETYGESFKSRLLVLDGVDLAAGIEVGTVGHEAARVILTGSGANGTNASVDQFLAVERGLGASTPHTSLVLGVGSEGTEIGVNLSYASGGTPIPKLIDPEKLFDELFGEAIGGERADALRARRALERSVLDLVKDDLALVGRRAPKSERVKLEQHATALREVEKRLSRGAPKCQLPARPDASAFPKLRAFGGGERYFERITELQIDLLALALSCDLTRFATLFLADLSRTGLYPDMPIDIHSEVAHRYSARDEKRAGDPSTWLPLARQNRHSYGHVARLMQRLSETGTLDDCILYVSSDMGDPARHSSRDVPTLLAGGAGGRFHMGRYVDLHDQRDAQGMLPNNRLLVAICRAFGVEIERFGSSANAATTQGDLTPLLRA